MRSRSIVPFSSPEGLKRLRSCRDLKAFGKIAESFEPQMDIYSCAVANLVICLNLFKREVPPFRQATLLSEKTDFIKTREALRGKDPGMTLDQVTQLAEFFGLQSSSLRPAPEKRALEKFRTTLKKSTASGKTVLIANFDLEKLIGSGGGHFAPLAAYHPGSDSVLVADVANHRTVWYWAPTELLMEAMRTIDSSSKLLRGYLAISNRPVKKG